MSGSWCRRGRSQRRRGVHEGSGSFEHLRRHVAHGDGGYMFEPHDWSQLHLAPNSIRSATRELGKECRTQPLNFHRQAAKRPPRPPKFVGFTLSPRGAAWKAATFAPDSDQTVETPTKPSSPHAPDRDQGQVKNTRNPGGLGGLLASWRLNPRSKRRSDQWASSLALDNRARAEMRPMIRFEPHDCRSFSRGNSIRSATEGGCSDIVPTSSVIFCHRRSLRFDSGDSSTSSAYAGS
jgi:hypothetical protein